MTRPAHSLAWLVLLTAGLLACATDKVFEPGDSAPVNPRDVSNVPNAVPRVESHSRYGNPASYVVYGKRYYPLKSSQDYRATGNASWYGTKFHGRRTSSGEPYDMYAMTAAHKTLPLPSYVEVSNLNNGRKVIVRVNDRGPFHDGRIIDLSYAAAVKLGMLGKGTTRVAVRAIDPRAAPAADPVRSAPPPAQAFIPPSLSANTPLYLQVGAFSNLDNAERLGNNIEARNIGGVRIVEATTDNGTLYKVQVGPLADTAEADQVARNLEPLGIRATRADVR